MKRLRWVGLILVLVFFVSLVPAGLPSQVSGLDDAKAALGSAQATITTESCVKEIVVFGVNQNRDYAEWPRSYPEGSCERRIVTEDYWWLFTDYFTGLEPVAPNVEITYWDGVKKLGKCDEDPGLTGNMVTCHFDYVATATSMPTGFTRVRGAPGVSLYQQNRSFVQVVNFSKGASVDLLLSPIVGSDPGAYGGTNPKLWNESLSTTWAEFAGPGESNPNAFCLSNGAFMGSATPPTNLSFPLKLDGKIVAEGSIESDQMQDDAGNRMLEIWPDRVLISNYSWEAFKASKAPNVIVGLGPNEPIKAGQSIGRTYVAVAGPNGNGAFKELLILDVERATTKQAGDILRLDFGLPDEQIMQLDGSASSQLICRNNLTLSGYSSENLQGRDVVQTLATLSASRGVGGTTYRRSYTIYPGQTIALTVAMLPDQQMASFKASWPGSDVVMTATSPSGRAYQRGQVVPDAIHDVGPTFEEIVVINPEPGEWSVTLYGAEVDSAGEPLEFEFTSGDDAVLPKHQLAYMDGTTLVLNMGTEERRIARRIEATEINEAFTVRQLSADLPGQFEVVAFGISQVFDGVTHIVANGADGDDSVILESANTTNTAMEFTAPASISGEEGQDFIQSGGADDLLSGGPGTDEILAGGGADTLDGGDDADTLNGEEGADSILAGGGSDTISGGDGDDTVDAGDGSDNVHGDAGNDHLSGAGDSDNLFGDSGDDWLSGGTGNDTLEGSDGADSAFGDEGDDLIKGQADDDSLSGGPGRDLLYGGTGNDQVHGDGQEDEAYGEEGSDRIYGDGEADRLFGNADDDFVFGGDGDDYVEGGPGSDELHGEANQDDLIGGSAEAGSPDGRDRIWGGPDHDVIVGDNASITRLMADGMWLRQTFSPEVVDVVQRVVTLFDAARLDFTPIDGVSGGDELWGDEGVDWLYGQGGDDLIAGGLHDDWMEGNAGADRMEGNDGNDDMIGGSALAGSLDAGDWMRGGSGDDILVADNGTIVRTLVSGLWQYLEGYGYHIPIRVVTMAEVPEVAGAFGDDDVDGQDGHDELYGQLGADLLTGGSGDDGLVGDLGRITTFLETGSRMRVISTKSPFMEATLFAAGTLYREVVLYAYLPGAGAEWDDILLGGAGEDVIHGGAGNDLANGNADSDALFGGDGNDVMWGGPDADHLFGGYGEDFLDVRPRQATATAAADPESWFLYGGVDHYQGLDIIYGGFDSDTMQADRGGPGPRVGDRLIDWVGVFNLYYTCPGLYGEGIVNRSHSPHVIQFLQGLAEGDGAVLTAQAGTSGFRELAMVFPNQAGQNNNAPRNPGHFTCGN